MEYAIANKGPLPCVEASLLNGLDNQITKNMLAGERQCKKKCNQCQLWSPQLRQIAKTFSYWKQKLLMAHQHFFRWDHLNRLHMHTLISDQEHNIRDPTEIKIHLKQARN